MTSRIPAVIDKLITVWSAAGIPVYDGPGVSMETPGLYVLVGVGDPDGESMEEAASSEQGWAYLGHTTLNETITIHCVAVSWNGDSAMKTARDQVVTALTTVADAVKNDPGLGQGQPTWVRQIVGISLRQIQDESGAAAYLPFDVVVQTQV